MKDLYITPTDITIYRTEPCEMYRLILAEGVWEDDIKVGRGVCVSWEAADGSLPCLEGDVVYRRSNIIHILGVLMT